MIMSRIRLYLASTILGMMFHVATLAAALPDTEAGMAALKQGDYALALQKFRTAADTGDAEAELQLATLLEQGKGVAVDPKAAFGWAMKSAEQGNADAQYMVGNLYASGKVGARNITEYLVWLKRAAQQGNRAAQVDLCAVYAIGVGQYIPVDLVEARKWATMAAEQGDLNSQTNVGIFARDGKGGPQDLALALKWFKSAAGQGHPLAQTNLATMYELGMGVKQDNVEALRLYRLAATGGNGRGMYHVGKFYDEGVVVVQNHKEALRWYRRSASTHEPFGAVGLSDACEKGKEMKKDPVAAFALILLAADTFQSQGLPDNTRHAREESTRLSRGLSPDQLAEAGILEKDMLKASDPVAVLDGWLAQSTNK